MTPGRDVRAARLVAHGRPLEVRPTELATPKAGEVVVEMAYAGVNPVDRYGILGTVAPSAPVPRTVGVEGVGRLGGRWVALHGFGLGTTRDGTWAEAVVVPEDAPVAVPDGVDPVHAASMGVAGATAWRTVVELAHVGDEDRVLVLGASGGVGTMIVSLSRSLGATVWGQTGRPAKVPAVETAGATRAVLAPDADSLGAALDGFRPTVVFDPLGAGYTGAAVEALDAHGRLVLFGTSAEGSGVLPLRALYRKGISLLGYGGLIEPDEALRRGIAGALDAAANGTLHVAVDAVVPLGQVNDALDRLAQRAVSGKLVLSLTD